MKGYAMPTLLLFVLLWLSAYRVSRFILDDTLIAEWRDEFYRYFPPQGTAFIGVSRVKKDDGRKTWEVGSTRKYSKIGDLFYCYWCIGFWISGAVVLIAMQFASVPLPVAWWCAISTAVGLTARNLDG